MALESQSPSWSHSLFLPSSLPTRLSKGEEGLITPPTNNYLLHVLMETDKEVIRMDRQGSQEGKNAPLLR